MMKAIGALAFLVATVAAFAEDVPTRDGTWIVVAAERNGKPADELKGHQLIFAGKNFTIKAKDGKVLYEGTFTADPAKKPVTIDFNHTGGEAKGKTWLGIYELDPDNSLKICDNSPDPSKPRPTAFTTRPDSGLVSLKFRKEKP